MNIVEAKKKALISAGGVCLQYERHNSVFSDCYDQSGRHWPVHMISYKAGSVPTWHNGDAAH